jgi:hypothetical protein
LQAPGVNPCAYEVQPWFQYLLAFHKCNFVLLHVGMGILKQTSDSYRKLRGTLRFLMGNLGGALHVGIKLTHNP